MAAAFPKSIAVRSFLDRLGYVRQWYEVARSHAHAAASRNDLLMSVQQVAQEQGRLEILDAARHVREAIVEAAIALVVRDLIAPDQFWSLYQPFAPLVPAELPLGVG